MGLRSEKLVKNDMNLYKQNKDKMEQGMQARRPRSAFVFVSPTFFCSNARRLSCLRTGLVVLGFYFFRLSARRERGHSILHGAPAV